MRRILLLSVATACGTNGGGEHPPTVEEAVQFIDRAEAELREGLGEADRTDWVQNTYITDDTEWLSARRTEQMMALRTKLLDEAKRFEGLKLPDASARKLKLLKVSSVLPAPTDAKQRRELAEIGAELTSMYGKGKACLDGDKDCHDINGLTKILGESRDPKRLEAAWVGWHRIAPPMRPKYQRFAELGNIGAKELGFANLGELWRARFDMTPAEFEAEVERLWSQVKPFYESLHCYVRKKLVEKYGPEVVPPKGPIPAHLLGNMWAQEWSGVYDLVVPYPEQPSLDVTKSLVAQKWDATKMMKTGESFFVSMGMPNLPETFWKRSMLTQPADRDVVCHASAWDIGMSGDVRIKMCTQVTEDDLVTIHHELGHIYYYLMYGKLPPLFQDGAHEGFHEGIGDTLALSMTPRYLKELGLLNVVAENPKADVNLLMKRALDKVAFLPWGKLVDQWRWQVFDGRTPAAKYNEAWWELRKQYQGVAPPVPRTEADFDPGAKYHVPANTPYTRYFLADILQFQFLRSLCKTAGHKGPLHTCSIYGSKEAGAKLAALLEMGASRPWQDALEALDGQRQMDASALSEYFAPLKTWLDEQNAGQTCGW
jgi:peptidyl-dipeptidase A